MIICKHNHQSEQYKNIVEKKFITELNLNIYLLGIAWVVLWEVRTQHFQCQGPGFQSLARNQDPKINILWYNPKINTCKELKVEN